MKTHEIRFSVVIPTLNEEKMLPQMLAQFTPGLRTEYGLEIIVSDGGSSDRTLSVTESVADRIVRHTLTRPQTIAEGRNNGAAVARGLILIFMNADTLMASPKKFFSAVEEAYRDETCDAIAFPIHVFPSERTVFDAVFHAVYNKYVHALNAAASGWEEANARLCARKLFAK